MELRELLRKTVTSAAIASLVGIGINTVALNDCEKDLVLRAANPTTSQEDRERIYDLRQEGWDATTLIPYYNHFSNKYKSLEKELEAKNSQF